MQNLLFCLLLFPLLAFAQKKEVFRIDSLPKEGILLNQGWKWHVGDDPEWAKVEFDDAGWEIIDPTLDIVDNLPQIPRPSGICWFRLKLNLDQRWYRKHLALQIFQTGASEIYLNGRLIKRLGRVASNPSEISAYDPLQEPIPFHVDQDSTVLISIRYTLQPNLKYTLALQRINPAFKAQINTLEAAQIYIDSLHQHMFHSIIFRFGAYLILLTCYLSFYLYYPSQKSNLFFGLFTFSEMIADFLQIQGYTTNLVGQIFNLYNCAIIFITLGFFFLLTALYLLLNQKRGLIYWALFLFVL